MCREKLNWSKSGAGEPCTYLVRKVSGHRLICGTPAFNELVSYRPDGNRYSHAWYCDAHVNPELLHLDSRPGWQWALERQEEAKA